MIAGIPALSVTIYNHFYALDKMAESTEHEMKADLYPSVVAFDEVAKTINDDIDVLAWNYELHSLLSVWYDQEKLKNAAATNTFDQLIGNLSDFVTPHTDHSPLKYLHISYCDTSGAPISTVIMVSDEEKPMSGLPSSLSNATQMRFESLIDSKPNAEAMHDTRPEDICTIMYTSGTTGPAKGVVMPQGHCYLFALGTIAAMELTSKDRYFCCMPLFHANGLFMQAYASLLSGASCHVTKRFSVTDWLSIVREELITVTNALGVMPEFIYRSPESALDQDHALTRILAIPVAEEWGDAMEDRFGVKLRQGFGMTEVNMVAYSDLDDGVLAGCAGPVLTDFFEVIIADPETDIELPCDHVGEILVRPKVPFCFNVGYFKMPEKTVEAWRNLWFHTGDAGRIDSDGRLFFVDRINDRIRRRGENISSYELEQALNEHPAVTESAAVGLRVDGAGGEDEIKAVLAINGPAPDPADFLDWCVPRMPRHTVPRYLEFVAELDKTASGKIRKQAIREAGVTPDTWDRESANYKLRRQ